MRVCKRKHLTQRKDLLPVVPTFRKSARAKHSNCRWPADNEDPPSRTVESSCSAKASTNSFRWAWIKVNTNIRVKNMQTCSSATQISWSVYAWRGSMLSRRVPSKRSGVWGTIEIDERTRTVSPGGDQFEGTGRTYGHGGQVVLCQRNQSKSFH